MGSFFGAAYKNNLPKGVKHKINYLFMEVIEMKAPTSATVDPTNKELVGDIPSKRRQFYPIFTVVVTIIDLSLLIWLLVLNKGIESPSVNPMFGPSPQTLLDAGAKYGPLLKDGEWWRFIAPIFLHSGLIHFILNIVFQFSLCWIFEIRYSTLIVLPVYVISGIAGNVLSAIFIPNAISVGASGALFGLWGMAIIDLIWNIKKTSRPCCMITYMIVSLLASLGLGLLPFVDNFAHIGGFIWGTLISIAIVPKIEPVKNSSLSMKRWRIIGRVITGFIAIASLIALIVVFYETVDPNGWCAGCQYLNCIPNVVNGTDWCSGLN